MNKISKIALAVVTLATAVSAHAELPAAVTTSISTAGTDGAMLGGLILAVLIGIAAFKWLRGAK